MKNLQVQELSVREQKNTNGGLAPLAWVVIGAACCLLLKGDERNKP